LNAGQQLGWFNRFDQVVVRTTAVPVQPVIQLAAGRHQHDPGQGLNTADALGQRETIFTRQIDINQVEVWHITHGQVIHLFCAGNTTGTVAMLAQKSRWSLHANYRCLQ